ncbi:MAG: pyruvate kinase [Candidatus Woesearchaeota archaeon]|jgi:pyruvate kinase
MEKHFKDRKTKIVCTIGPSSNTPEMLEKMAEQGMDIARLNFSHGAHEDHLKIIEAIKKINETREIPIGIILDTKGPEIRTGKFKEPVILEAGNTVILTTEELEWCTKEKIYVNYKNLQNIVKKGSLVFIADGSVELKVEEVKGNEVVCKVVVSSEVNTKKNVNVPNVFVDLPAISEQDISDIEFGIKNGIDFIAQSFVKKAEDVLAVKEILLRNNAKHVHIIAKIESFEGLQNLDEIIEVSDGIMVARGDLGVQIPIESIPTVQKRIIKKCNVRGKPVITATQMLESMIKNPRPTRAEATDIANAIFDGTDAIMLSGETASGKHPLRVIEFMDKIARHAEKSMIMSKHIWIEDFRKDEKGDIAEAISSSVCQTACDLEAGAIISCTFSGHTARQISKHRPLVPIIAVTPNEDEFKKLLLVWGVKPILIRNPKNTDDLVELALSIAKSKKLVEVGEKVVITAGIPFNVPGNINLMKVKVIE